MFFLAIGEPGMIEGGRGGAEGGGGRGARLYIRRVEGRKGVERGREGKKSDKKLTLPKAGIGRDRSHWPAAKKSHRISGRGEICN